MTTITSSIQENKDTLDKIPETEIAFSSGDTVKEITINANALTNRIVLKLPVFSGAIITAMLTIEDSDGNEIFRQAGLVEDETHVMIDEVELIGDNIFKVTLSTDPLSSGSCFLSGFLKGV
ncbi:MAG: hypothetical protein JRC90_11540 [Deltaproteobacteria bacterium]|nr:hypothetical protein [Deltaproteobacteria bacterium]